MRFVIAICVNCDLMPLLNRTVVSFGTHVFSKDYVTMVMSMHI